MPDSRGWNVNSRGLSEREPVVHHHRMTITFRAVIAAALATACSHPTGAARLAGDWDAYVAARLHAAAGFRGLAAHGLRPLRVDSAASRLDSSSDGGTDARRGARGRPRRLRCSSAARAIRSMRGDVARRHALGSDARRRQAERPAVSARASRRRRSSPSSSICSGRARCPTRSTP